MKIPVESAMNDCVQAFGGELGANLRPSVNSPKNADYVFREDNVVAELKCLENDLFTLAHAQKLGLLVPDWTRRRLLRRVYRHNALASCILWLIHYRSCLLAPPNSIGRVSLFYILITLIGLCRPSAQAFGDMNIIGSNPMRKHGYLHAPLQAAGKWI